MLESENESRIYEIGFLLVPGLSQEGEVSEEIEKLHTAIETAGGQILTEGAPEYIDLAYPVEGSVASGQTLYREAYFGWIKFALDPASLEAFKETVNRLSTVVRYLIIKTDRENTIQFKKPKEMVRRQAPEVAGGSLSDEKEGEVKGVDASPDHSSAEVPLTEEVPLENVEAVPAESVETAVSNHSLH